MCHLSLSLSLDRSLSLYIYIYLFIYMYLCGCSPFNRSRYVYIYLYLSFSPSLPLSLSLSLSLALALSLSHLSLYLSIYSIYLSIYLSIYIYVSLFRFFLSICLERPCHFPTLCLPFCPARPAFIPHTCPASFFLIKSLLKRRARVCVCVCVSVRARLHAHVCFVLFPLIPSCGWGVGDQKACVGRGVFLSIRGGQDTLHPSIQTYIEAYLEFKTLTFATFKNCDQDKENTHKGR